MSVPNPRDRDEVRSRWTVDEQYMLCSWDIEEWMTAGDPVNLLKNR